MQIVTHLPVSPRAHAALGFYAAPVFSHLLGCATGQRPVHAVNLLGQKTLAGADFKEEYVNVLRLLGVESDGVWQDTDPAHISFIHAVLRNGLQSGWIREKRAEILSCPCGKTELIPDPEHTLPDIALERAYTVDGTNIRCSFCKEIAEQKETPCLFFVMPKDIPIPKRLYPNYALCEYETLRKKFTEKAILVSRTAERNVRFETETNAYWIDTDAAWMPFLSSLAASQGTVQTLLTGHRTLKHALFTIAFAAQAGTGIPENLIALPYVRIDFGSKEAWDGARIVKEYGRKAATYFLAIALGYSAKELIIPSKLFHVLMEIERGEPFETVDASVDIKAILQHCRGKRLQTILPELRRNRGNLASIDRLLLSLIFRDST